MGGAQDTVDDVEVAAGKLLNHLRQQTLPLVWKVFTTNDTDGVAQLNIYIVTVDSEKYWYTEM